MRSLISVTLVVIAGVSALAAATEGFQVFTAEGARRLEVSRHPQAIPDLELENAFGQRFYLSDLKGKRLVVEFFYTGCQTLCVTLAGSLGELQHQLKSQGNHDVHLLSISFSPRDDTARLADYARRLRVDAARWTIARPAHGADIDDLLHAFGIVVIANEFGDFDHNAALHVLDREGQLSLIADYDQPAQVAHYLGLAP